MLPIRRRSWRWYGPETVRPATEKKNVAVFRTGGHVSGATEQDATRVLINPLGDGGLFFENVHGPEQSPREAELAVVAAPRPQPPQRSPYKAHIRQVLHLLPKPTSTTQRFTGLSFIGMRLYASYTPEDQKIIPAPKGFGCVPVRRQAVLRARDRARRLRKRTSGDRSK